MYGGKFVLEWNDGRKRDIGVVTVDPTKLGAECRIGMRRFRIGMEFIRIGIKILMRGFGNERSVAD